MRDIYDTLSKYIICNHAEKLTDEDIEFIPEFVWFTEDGVSKRGWINPATGKNTAIKAKQQPVVNSNKIGPNEKCPCGSGKKYKKCCKYKDK